MSEENINKETQEDPPTERSEIIEVSWEQVKDVFEHRSALLQTEDYLGKMAVQYERKKSSLLRQIVQLEENLYTLATNLKSEANIDPELTYELKLPEKPGEKAYFLRKEE